MYIECKAGRSFMGRIERGLDLLGELNDFCVSHNITLGQIQVIGAVEKAEIGWYDQQKQGYTHPITLLGGLEILSCIGTISLLNREPHIHAHVLLSTSDGTTYGGHLYSGTIVYNAEFIIQEQIGPPLNRKFDKALRAPVWFSS